MSCKDEKNQILTTNAWLQMVSIIDNINNVILICIVGSFLQIFPALTDTEYHPRCWLDFIIMLMDASAGWQLFPFTLNTALLGASWQLEESGSALFLSPKITNHSFAVKQFANFSLEKKWKKFPYYRAWKHVEVVLTDLTMTSSVKITKETQNDGVCCCWTSFVFVSPSSGMTTTSNGTSQNTLESRTSVLPLSRFGHLTYCYTTGMWHTNTSLHNHCWCLSLNYLCVAIF